MLTYILTWVVHAITLVLLNNKSQRTDYDQARRDYVLPNLLAAMLLNLLFGISWIFALLGTDIDISNNVSIGSQYVFGFLILIHAAFVLVVNFARSRDTRNVWLTCFGTVGGRSKSYSVSSSQHHSTKTPKDEGIEMTVENVYSATPTKEPLPEDDEKKPLTEYAETPTSQEPAGAKEEETGTMTEVNLEVDVQMETVMTNFGAEGEEDEEKTDL